MKKAWLAWLGLFLFLMPFVVQVIMINHSLHSINPKDPDASTAAAMANIGAVFSFQQYVALPIQILGLCMLATWLVRTLSGIAEHLAQKERAAKLHGQNQLPA
jgi:hypothetical protein